jgi:hypothetical protein
MTEFWSDLIFWLEFVLLIVAAVLMIWRRLHREFPFLFAYYLSEITVGIVRRSFILAFTTHSMPYFYAYWLSETFTLLAAFAALYEVFLIRMFPTFQTTPFFRYLLPLVIVVGFAVAVIVFLKAPAPRHGPHPLSVFVGQITLALNFLQVVLLLLFSLILVTLGGGWEEHEYGIVLGYGIYAISKLVTTAVRAKAAYATTAIDQLPVIGYFAALIVWIIYLSRRYRPPDVNISIEVVERVRSWDKLLRDLQGRRRR